MGQIENLTGWRRRVKLYPVREADSGTGTGSGALRCLHRRLRCGTTYGPLPSGAEVRRTGLPRPAAGPARGLPHNRF